ncbi:MAG TPA: PKD domain-containing protein, partial [Vicingus sp.]|nr:PKD domain-containing protein [Vicingus sp.]
TISGTPNDAGTYNYSIPLTGGCGTVNATGTITVNPIPSNAGSIAGSVSECDNATGVAYSISSVSGATGSTWTVPSGATIASGQGTTNITVDFGTTSGNVAVTPTNSCGNGGQATKAVTIAPCGSAPVANFSVDATTICLGESVDFTDLSSNSPTSWLWNFGDGGSSSSQNTTYTYNTPGTYTVTLTATNASGSDDEEKTNLIVVSPQDDASFSYITSTYCQDGVDPTPTINGTLGGTFSRSPVGLVINSSTGVIDLSASTAGTYTVTYTTGGNCSDFQN